MCWSGCVAAPFCVHEALLDGLAACVRKVWLLLAVLDYLCGREQQQQQICSVLTLTNPVTQLCARVENGQASAMLNVLSPVYGCILTLLPLQRVNGACVSRS
jgi:hypothetical protein